MCRAARSLIMRISRSGRRRTDQDARVRDVSVTIGLTAHAPDCDGSAFSLSLDSCVAAPERGANNRHNPTTPLQRFALDGADLVAHRAESR